jgi:hypothetical protein
MEQSRSVTTITRTANIIKMFGTRQRLTETPQANASTEKSRGSVGNIRQNKDL